MKIPEYIIKVINVLNDNGFECYLVGGCVRDSLMGMNPHDFDLTTNALPCEIIECFKDMRIIETGLKHGTVTVVSDGENIEITTYRVDGKYIDNRRPESVCFTGKIAEDLSRRDFTINAIAYSPYDGYVDLFNGNGDIKNRIIRCVGNPDKRFNEDGLRIMRALRFSSVLSFDIDDVTAESIHKNKVLLNNISRERIYSEFQKLVCGKGAYRILRQYFDVFCVIFKNLELYEGIILRNTCAILDVEDFVSRMVVLLFGVDIDFVKRILKSLKPDNKTYKDIILLHENVCKNILCDEISIKRIMSRLSDELINKLIKIKKVLYPEFDSVLFMYLYNKLLNENACVTIKQLKIDGTDLKQSGISHGPEIGKVLNYLLDAVIENRCDNTKDKLLSYLQNNYDKYSQSTYG